MKLIMCNEKELDSLMNRKEIYTSKWMLYSVCLESEPLKLEDLPELWVHHHLKGNTKIINKYFNVADVTSILAISSNIISRIMSGDKEIEEIEQEMTAFSKRTIRQFKGTNPERIGPLALLLTEVLELDYAIFVVDNPDCFPKFIKDYQFRIIKEIIEENSLCPLPIFTKEEYIDNPEMCEVVKSKAKWKKCVRYLYENGTRKNSLDTIIHYCVPPQMVPRDVPGYKHRKLAALMEMWGCSKEDYTYANGLNENKPENLEIYAQMKYIFANILANKWYKVFNEEGIDIKELEEPEIALWLDRLGVNYQSSMGKKVLKRRLKEEITNFEKRNDTTSREYLESIPLRTLQKILWDEGISESPYEDRNKAIKALMMKSGKYNKSFCIPTRKELKCLNKKDLWELFTNYVYNPKYHANISYDMIRNYDKSTIVDFIIEESRREAKENSFDGVYMDDIESLENKEQLLNLINARIRDKTLLKEVIKETEDMNEEKIIGYLQANFKIKYRYEVEGITLYTKEELKGMSDKDLFKRAKELRISVYDKTRKEIIKECLEVIKEEKRKRERMEKRTEITIKNLQRLDRKGLIRLCKLSGVRYDLSWSKSKFVKTIYKNYIGEEEKKEEDSPEEKKILKEVKKMTKTNTLGLDLMSYKDYDDLTDYSKVLDKIEEYEKAKGIYEEDYIEQEVKEIEKYQEKYRQEREERKKVEMAEKEEKKESMNKEVDIMVIDNVAERMRKVSRNRKLRKEREELRKSENEKRNNNRKENHKDENYMKNRFNNKQENTNKNKKPLSKYGSLSDDLDFGFDLDSFSRFNNKNNRHDEDDD